MAGREQVAIRLQLALEAIREVLVKHDGELAGERLRKAAGAADETAVPSLKQPDLVAAFLAESVATMAKIMDEKLTPRKRGRPPKK